MGTGFRAPAALLAITCTLALAGQTLAAAPAPTPGFTHIRTLVGIREYRLDQNGLTVLLNPISTSPVVSFQVVYRVGSRNEVTGTTGSTHLLEHLMFKGSDAHNHDEGTSLDQFLERVGGGFNASTNGDRTNYFATLAPEHLEGIIAIEADRMRNLWLKESDRAAEMTVVRNEYERGENDPGNALGKEVLATAYLAHPYHHSTIGWRSDIEHVPQQKLRDFYDTYYWPDNATVTVVGNFDIARTLALIGKFYGAIPRAPTPIPEVYTEEPEQTGARRVILKRPGQLGIVTIAHKIPAALHADLPALGILGAILGDGKNSRLYKALIDTNLATEASAAPWLLRDPGIFFTDASLAPGATHEQVEKILLAEIDRIKEQGVTPEEVARAIRQYHVKVAFRGDGPSSIGGSLAGWIARGDWTQYVTYEEKVKALTPADIQRVARRYLNADQSTTGWFVPEHS